MRISQIVITALCAFLSGGVVHSQDWFEAQTLTPNSVMPGDEFGIDVSTDGTTMFIGARSFSPPGFTDAGAVFVYESDSSGWILTQTLIASDAADFDRFGKAVAVDGNCGVVGSGAELDPGKAYFFERSPLGVWEEKQIELASDFMLSNACPGDNFGGVVSLLGDTAVISADNEDEGPDGDGCTFGEVYVFENQGGTWNEVAQLTKLIDAGTNFKGRFGISHSFDGNRILVGSRGGKGGLAFLFDKPSNWAYAEEIIRPAVLEGIGDDFGWSVDISGNRLVIGARLKNQTVGQDAGAAYIFELNPMGDTFDFADELFAPAPAMLDSFGKRVAIDGTRAIVAAPGNDGAGLDSGEVSVYEQPTGGQWSNTGILPPCESVPGDFLGGSLFLDGDMAFASSPASMEGGKVIVFQFGGVPAASATFEGNGGNPLGFTSTTEPVIGEVWSSSIDMTMPTIGDMAILSVITLGGGTHPGFPLPRLGTGSILILPPYHRFIGNATGLHNLTVPCDSELIGVSVAFQGFRFETILATGDVVLEFLNAIVLTIGV